MLIQKIKTYKWQALASLLMTGLMVASSLLQPRYLQEVLDALLAGKYEAIYKPPSLKICVSLLLSIFTSNNSQRDIIPLAILTPIITLIHFESSLNKLLFFSKLFFPCL